MFFTNIEYIYKGQYMSSSSSEQNDEEQIKIARTRLRREETESIRIVKGIYIERNRGRGRPKTRYGDVMYNDMKSAHVGEKNTENRDV